MSNDRLLRPNVGFYLAHPENFANFDAAGTATSTELNTAFVYDITCALAEADSSMVLDNSDTDTELTFCSVGNETVATTHHATAQFAGFRDASKTNATVFNLFRDLNLYPDVDWVVIKRVGFPATTAFAAGQDVSMVRVSTDFPQDTIGDNANEKLTQNYVTSGTISWNYSLVA